MIFNRTAHRVASLPSKTPCWSGPRWYKVSVMRRARPLFTARSSRVNPAIPHIYAKFPVPRKELLFPSILRWICAEYSTPRVSLGLFGCGMDEKRLDTLRYPWRQAQNQSWTLLRMDYGRPREPRPPGDRPAPGFELVGRPGGPCFPTCSPSDHR